MTLAAKSFAAAVNHLLIRESWARERLARYAGKSARLTSPPFVLTLVVQADGLLASLEAPSEAPSAAVPPDSAALGSAPAIGAQPRYDVSISVPTGAWPAFAQGGQAALMQHVKIDGDAEFAATIAKLAEHLRWEPEEDLARLVGDAPAHRLGNIARAVSAQAGRTGRNLLEALAEYLLDENPQLVRRAALSSFTADLAQTRDALARLEKRLERAEAGARRAPAAPAAPAAATGQPPQPRRAR
jgi:ubiquinone biosynthesis protein UbiJ